MKNKSKLHQIVSLISFIGLLTVSGYGHAYDNHTISEAKSAYEKGMQSLQNKDWSTAAQNLSHSHDLVPFPMTAYLASVAYAQSEVAERALRYATMAINNQPNLEQALINDNKLKQPYIQEARRIIHWAQNYEKASEEFVKLTGKADSKATCTKCPAPPSNVNTPHNYPFKIGTPTPVNTNISNLTGTWHCNDHGNYFIRQVGKQVWWLGQSSDGGNTWTNVFHGRRTNKNMIIGQWTDLPRGKSHNAGNITLKITNSGTLKATHRTGGFGGSEWTRH